MDRNARRMNSSDLEKDRYAYLALQGIAGYAPVNNECSLERLTALNQTCQENLRVEVQKEGEYKAARDSTVKSEHDFHDAILKAKDQIRAQFGADSNEYQSLGLKKKSEYKTRRTTGKSK